MINTEKGWKFDNGSNVNWAVNETDLEEYVESLHGKNSITKPLTNFEKEKLENEYQQRAFKQTGDNEWQQITDQ